MEYVGIRAKMYSILMSSSEEVTAGTDIESLVQNYEKGKSKKGFNDGVKTLAYMRNKEGELVQDPMEVSAYESSTTKGIKTNIATVELRHRFVPRELNFNAALNFIAGFTSCSDTS
eukprot:2359844-Prymnesium_polylepis.1